MVALNGGDNIRPIAFTCNIIEVFPFVELDKSKNFGEFILEELSNEIDAIALHRIDSAICRYCGSANLKNEDERYEFYSIHKTICNINDRIEFLQCLM